VKEVGIVASKKTKSSQPDVLPKMTCGMKDNERRMTLMSTAPNGRQFIKDIAVPHYKYKKDQT